MQGYSVAAVDYAVDVLLAVAETPDQGVSEIARRLGGSKQRIFRMLRTLEARGLLVRDRNRVHDRAARRRTVRDHADAVDPEQHRTAGLVRKQIGRPICDLIHDLIRLANGEATDSIFFTI